MQIPQSSLEFKVSSLLDTIYELRIEKIANLDLRTVLLRKNPYLFRTIVTNGNGRDQQALDFAQRVLDATISSSDETIFGNEFFEPLALWVAQQAQIDGSVAGPSSAEGADLDVEFPDQYRMYAIKSGTAVFNSSSWRRQLTNFNSARSRMTKTKKQFDPVIGYGYGRSNSGREVREVAGQAFWAELSGEPAFYLRIMQAAESGSRAGHSRFDNEYWQTIRRFVWELKANFGGLDGNIDWIKLLEFNSAQSPPSRAAWRKAPVSGS